MYLVSDRWRRLSDLVCVGTASIIVQRVGIEHTRQLVTLSRHMMVVVYVVLAASRCSATLIRIDTANAIIRVVDVVLLRSSYHFAHSLPRLHVAYDHSLSAFILCHVYHAAIVAAYAELTTFGSLTSISNIYVLRHNICF